MDWMRIRQKQYAVRFATKGTGKDSVSLSSLEVDQTYSVGIELEKALAKPKSDEDLVLREGDVLFVPKYVSTVTVNGAVMYPNTVLYQKGSGIDYYIGQAGGFENRALKRLWLIRGQTLIWYYVKAIFCLCRSM